MEEQKISLKQKPFVVFSLFYSRVMIIGWIAMSYIGDHVPEFLSWLIYAGIFAYALFNALSRLKSNDRTLISTNTSLMMKERVKKKDVLTFKIDDYEVEKV